MQWGDVERRAEWNIENRASFSGNNTLFFESVAGSETPVYESSPYINTSSLHDGKRPTPRSIAATFSISEKLQECSRTLGVSEESLLDHGPTIAEISQRVDTFLARVNSTLPTMFSTKLRNPCWTVEKLNFSNYQINKIMSRFRPVDGRRARPIVGGRIFDQYLSKPISENSTSRKSLLCLPYFFLAGFPKSATTTVHSMLSKLPGIVASGQGKEPHWWTRALYLSGPKFSSKLIPIAFMSYAHFFDSISLRLLPELDQVESKNASLITYDGSQSILWDSNFFYGGQDFCAMPVVISTILPHAKFIVVMRNPVTRLYSHFMYSYKLRYGAYKNWPESVRRNGSRIFHDTMVTDVADYRACLERMSAFECASSSVAPATELDSTQLNRRITIGLYVVHIKKWMQFYPKENFLFLKMEDLTQDAYEAATKITNFLDLDPVSNEDISLEKKNVLSHNFQPMEERTKSLLEEFYRPFNEALAALLHDDRYLWKD